MFRDYPEQQQNAVLQFAANGMLPLPHLIALADSGTAFNRLCTYFNERGKAERALKRKHVIIRTGPEFEFGFSFVVPSIVENWKRSKEWEGIGGTTQNMFELLEELGGVAEWVPVSHFLELAKKQKIVGGNATFYRHVKKLIELGRICDKKWRDESQTARRSLIIA